VELEPIPIAVWVKIPVLEIAVRRFNILDREKSHLMFAVKKLNHMLEQPSIQLSQRAKLS